MASQDQVIVDEGIKSRGSATYGMRVQANLNAAYPESPIYLEEITDKNREEIYNNLLNSNVCENYTPSTGIGVVPGGTGLGVDNFYTDFTEGAVLQDKAPDIASNEKTKNGLPFGKGAGAPTTPYIPPLTSPGVGNFSAAKQGPHDDINGKLPVAGGEYGSGQGSIANPSVTSKEVESVTLGSYISGRSYATSDKAASETTE